MIDVSIIIVSYDTKKMLCDCVRSIIAQTDECTYEITVIDNDSDDGSADAVQAEFKRVQVIRTGENCGFGRASNWAAKDAKGRRILLLNPDTIVIDKAIDRLNGFANQYPNAKIWGGRTFLEDGSLDQRCCRRHLNLWSLFCFVFGLAYAFPKKAVLNSELARLVDVVTGSFLLIDRALWEALNGFDPIYFMYGEEIDLCRRATTHGATPMFSPHAALLHYGGRSETSAVDKRIKLLKAHITFIKRHWRGTTLFWGLVLFRILPLPRKILYHAASNIRPKYRSNAETWGHVWQVRNIWMNGYSALDNR